MLRATLGFEVLEAEAATTGDLDFAAAAALVVKTFFRTAKFDLAIGFAPVDGNFTAELALPFAEALGFARFGFAATDGFVAWFAFVLASRFTVVGFAAFCMVLGFAEVCEIAFNGEPGFVGFTVTAAFIVAVAFVIAGFIGTGVLRCGGWYRDEDFGICTECEEVIPR